MFKTIKQHFSRRSFVVAITLLFCLTLMFIAGHQQQLLSKKTTYQTAAHTGFTFICVKKWLRSKFVCHKLFIMRNSRIFRHSLIEYSSFIFNKISCMGLWHIRVRSFCFETAKP